MVLKYILDIVSADVNAIPDFTACGDSLPSVEKSPINQRFLRFWKKNRCVFLFPQSEDISRGLPQGIGFGEREIYILAKGYFLAKEMKSRLIKLFGNIA